MSNMTETFKAWMDRKGLTPEAVAARFRVQKQTIHNWRSAGIPERRQAHVLAVMASWTDEKSPSEAVLQPLNVPTTAEQLTHWTNAWKNSGTDLEFFPWVIAAIDRMADEIDRRDSQAAANEMPHEAPAHRSQAHG